MSSSPTLSSDGSSVGGLSPPGGGGAKLTPAPPGHVSQIPGQKERAAAARSQPQQSPQPQFAGYGIGLHNQGGQEYEYVAPTTSAHQASWGHGATGPAHQSQGIWGPPPPSREEVGSGGGPPPLYLSPSGARPSTTPYPGGLGDGHNSNPAEGFYKAFRTDVQHLHKRVLGMHEAMGRQAELPQRFVAAIKVDLVQMIKTIETLPSNVQTMNKMVKDLDQELQTVKVLFVQQNLENDTLHSKAKNQITSLEYKIRELMEENMAQSSKIGALNTQRAIDKETIRRLQEQVDGKRNLWMQMHPEPSERAAALAYHAGVKPAPPSFTSSKTLNPESAAATSTNWRHNVHGHQKTPSRSTSTPIKADSRFQEPRLGASRHAHASSPETTPKPQFRLHRDPGPSRPAAPPASAVDEYFSDMTLNSPEGTVIKADPSPLKTGRTNKSRALEADLKLAAKAPLQFWQEQIRKLWALSRGFCASHVTTDYDTDLPAFVQGKAPRVWDSIAASLYPRDPKARDQGWQAITELLRDPSTRSHLAQRLIIQQILRDIFRPSGWIGFEMDVDEELQRVQKQIDEQTTFKPHDRTILLDRRAVLILSMLDNARWDQFRHTKVNEHFQAIKQAVWALCPDDNRRGEMHENAHFDLFSMIEVAWELATKMYLSRADFYFSWPEIGDKYTPEIHDLADRPTPGQELKYGRVRLAVTPGVTMRKPEGMRVVPKGILKATVLVV
ncbi:hypothetical protein QBC39DRAFT_103140 [Podospora conica]|nr:hypothetical protein QBC39DRAFT_103140 [Schizothecium conicum]